MAYNKKDHYYHKAKEENYAARSIYKLEEINQKFKIIKHGMNVLDLGAAPGSWSQYLSQEVGEQGHVLGIDLISVGLTLPNATFIHADLRDINLESIIQEHGIKPMFDGVFSDMAPKTTGIRVTDQARSTELCELALEVAQKFLKLKGCLVIKFFHSEDFESLKKKMQSQYKRVEVLRPKSTRKESKEVFLIGIDKTHPCV